MLAAVASTCHNHIVVIRHDPARLGCEGCAHGTLEVTDEYAVVESSVEAEVLSWRCSGCGSEGERVVPLLAESLDPVAA